MSKSIGQRARNVLDALDREGRDISIGDWIALLSIILNESRSRLNAANDDLNRADKL